jgi:hypothetical protein
MSKYDEATELLKMYKDIAKAKHSNFEISTEVYDEMIDLLNLAISCTNTSKWRNKEMEAYSKK